MKIKINIQRIGITIFLISFIIGSSIIFKIYKNNKLIAEDAADIFEEEEPVKCEDGEWIDFPPPESSSNLGKYEAQLSFVKNEKDQFITKDGSIIFSTDDNYSLYFFMDRQVAIEGVKTGKAKGKEVYVTRIKCIGEEADKKIKVERQNLMEYISANINDIAQEKSAKSHWQVGSFYFANNTDLYVEYESQASFLEEAPYDAKLWLIRISKADAGKPQFETLAYIHEDANDPEKNIISQGEDLYEDVKNLIIYEFDPGLKRWIIQ